jgi:hypothetical protein
MTDIKNLIRYSSIILPTSTVTISPIPTNRLNSFLQTLGNASSTPVVDPNFGMMLFNLASVYVDSLGQIAWVIMFAIPFIMMFIAGSDMRLPSIVGIMASLYVFLHLPQQYIVFGVACFMICLSALLYSLYRRAY